jgi:Bacterial PH domain
MIWGLAVALAVILLAGVVVLLGWLVGGGVKHDTTRGQTVLRFGPRFRGLGLVGVVMAVIIVVVFAVRVFLGFDRPELFIFPVGVAGLFVLLSTPLLLIGFRTEVRLDDAGIASRRVFGGSTHIPWEAVEGITSSAQAGGFFVRGAGLRVKVPFLLHGRDVFVEECRKRLPPDRYGDAFDRPLPPLVL